jgi:hypothetical protein
MVRFPGFDFENTRLNDVRSPDVEIDSVEAMWYLRSKTGRETWYATHKERRPRQSPTAPSYQWERKPADF